MKIGIAQKGLKGLIQMKIGVLVDGDGMATAFESGGFLKVYEVTGSSVELLKERVCAGAAGQGAEAIRAGIRELAQWLGDCKVIVASRLKGICFTVFDGLLFNMWEVSGDPAGFLDLIRQRELMEQEEARRPEKIHVPKEKGRNTFFIDLEAVLDSDGSATSKKVLLPFLRKESFKALEVKCGHVPRWFEKELPALKMESAQEKTEDGYLVTIKPITL
ncbi:MAG: hypothetical protein LBU32_25395 [Clostridiales bacterium]|jgi:Fe-only nitrogenase accessory protein AnfO|nr:hypothetical protein [Clostridiales bacterium]